MRKNGCCQGREGGTSDALHRDAQGASSPQPLVQELRHGPEKGSYVLDLAVSKLVLYPQGDRSISCVNMRVDARQRGCQTHKDQLFIEFCCCCSKILYI